MCQLPLPDAIVHELSSDQKLLHQLAICVQSGSVPENTATEKIGPVNHAKWLTLGASLLRLYITTCSPGRKLKDVVAYLVGHYVQM